MAARSWNKKSAQERIDKKIADMPLKNIEIKEYVKDTNLAAIGNNTAYRVDGVHVYADILNLDDMLRVTDIEGETCHKRTLRFLNQHYRAADRIIARVEAIFVDFHNQRLHSVVAKPYDSEAKRIHRAIAMGQLIIDVLAQTGEDADHPAAKVRIGIDSGKALAVNNGRRGHREPLFLGVPANHAAKRAGGGSAVGIYLTNVARKVIGLKAVSSEDATALTADEIKSSQDEAKLDVTADQVVKEWQEDLKNSPIGSFEFSGHTPPFSALDMDVLSAKNSRRQDAVSIYADLDGFTAYVGANIATDDQAKHVVRTLHLLRSELDAVLHADFKGRKVRFIGDCVHGLLVEGTAQTTDDEETVSNVTLCAAAMRSSFKLGLQSLKNAGTTANLGLAIGFEYGPMTATRLGIKGGLVRCSVSRGVIVSEELQCDCNGRQTKIGPAALDVASNAVKGLFDANGVATDLEYEGAVDAMSAKGDKVGNAAKAAAGSLLQPASAAATPLAFPNRAAGPAKPGGFA